MNGSKSETPYFLHLYNQFFMRTLLRFIILFLLQAVWPTTQVGSQTIVRGGGRSGQQSFDY